MSTISVYLYGYKSKSLPDAVNSLIANSSGMNDLRISVYDQVNIPREDKFPNTSYNHVMWDNISSPFMYLENELEQSNSEYFMYINGAMRFEKNWDVELVMGHGGRRVVISGNNAISFNNQNLKFYPSYTKHVTDSALITNWITNDFIFMKTEDFRSFPKLSQYIKYYGIEEVYSLFAIKNGFAIQCIATAWASPLDGGVHASDYIPFSLKHGYTHVTNMFHKKENVFFDSTAEVDLLSKIVNFNFSELSPLPFSHDDITYDPKMELDGMGERRFYANVRSIG